MLSIIHKMTMVKKKMMMTDSRHHHREESITIHPNSLFLKNSTR